MRHFALLVFGLVSMHTRMAPAATFTATYNFDFGGFVAINGPTDASIPMSQVSGSFSTTFETNFGSGTNLSTLDSIDLTINGFDYTPSNTELLVTNARAGTEYFTGRFDLGGEANGGLFAGGAPSDDFLMSFTDLGNLTGTINEFLSYTVATSRYIFEATTFDISRVSVSVPEPNTLIQLVVAASVLVLRRR